MKKILIISPGYFSIINNLNGAIENLLKSYLFHNEKTKKFQITVYSVDNGNEPLDTKTTIDGTEFRLIDITKPENFFSYKI